LLLIRLTADAIRLIERANTEPELRGVRQLILDQIQISKTLKEFGRVPKVGVAKYLGWAKAFQIAEEVVGRGNLTKPPYPDNSWYARLNGVLKRECMTEDTVRELAEYCRDNLRSPLSFDFMIAQQHRIRTGEFNVKPKKDLVPEMPLLPDVDEDETSHDWRNDA
jgi:hypothetical protein